jgi:hypothetical protein
LEKLDSQNLEKRPGVQANRRAWFMELVNELVGCPIGGNRFKVSILVVVEFKYRNVAKVHNSAIKNSTTHTCAASIREAWIESTHMGIKKSPRTR